LYRIHVTEELRFVEKQEK